MKFRTKVLIGGIMALGECTMHMCEKAFSNGLGWPEQVNRERVAIEQEYCREGEVCPI
jgi:hypothetical protein